MFLLEIRTNLGNLWKFSRRSYLNRSRDQQSASCWLAHERNPVGSLLEFLRRRAWRERLGRFFERRREGGTTLFGMPEHRRISSSYERLADSLHFGYSNFVRSGSRFHSGEGAKGTWLIEYWHKQIPRSAHFSCKRKLCLSFRCFIMFQCVRKC